MRWNEIDSDVCSVARTLSVIGERWTLLVLRDCFMGSRRFDEFQKNIGLSRHRLSDRLNKLVEHQLLEKKLYQNNPPRSEYLLTEKGIDIYPVILSLVGWGNKWMNDEDGDPMVYHHKGCDHETHPVLSCDHCGDKITARDIIVKPGPGIMKKYKRGQMPAYLPRHLQSRFSDELNENIKK